MPAVVDPVSGLEYYELSHRWSMYTPAVFRSKLTAWMYGDNELHQQTRARWLSRIPLGRLGEVEDLIGMAIYFVVASVGFLRWGR